MMAGDAARVALALLLLLGAGDTAQHTARAGAVPEAPLWTLEVLTLQPTSATVLWVGVINQSNEARLVCILDRGISYSEKAGPSKASGEGGSPHACDSAEQFQLVRAGQTHFIRLPLPARLADRISGPLRVEVGVIDRPVVGNASPREPVGVKWEGTLQEAADHGRALTAPPKTGR